MDNTEIRKLAIRLTDIRTDMLKRYPFFGRLLMRLPFGFADCGTAYTDMQKIVFDPSFASGLNDDALCFLLLHELMHCVLKHCTRGNGKLNTVYNIACDIVVNSIILEALGLDEIKIGKSNAMHLTPLGTEGRNYSAEEVYKMLVNYPFEDINNISDNNSIDNHDVWEEILSDGILEAVWNRHINAASKAVGKGSGIPDSLKRLVSEIYHTPKICWKQVLHDFIQYDKSDYVFTRPDRRFSDDIVMPSFENNVDGAKVEKIWFLVDTSGSVSDRNLKEALEEINDAMKQIGNLSGYLSFFDCKVSEPMPFESIDELNAAEPIGGGGTSFKVIFEHINDYFEEPPRAIIIMTDGYAAFPKEEVAQDIPVIWIIIDSDVDAPWGECVHIYSQ